VEERDEPAHGAALVLVLWLIALMTALVGAFALSARVEHLQQRVLDDDARGQERARAGLEYALTAPVRRSAAGALARRWPCLSLAVR
jgi:type II secretory pathway component PulK